MAYEKKSFIDTNDTYKRKMTIQKAREILKEEIADLTDDQVIELIQNVGGVCDVILDVVVKDFLTHKKQTAYYE